MPRTFAQNVITMELWTSPRCWCILYVLAVIIHSRAAAHGYSVRYDNKKSGSSSRPSGRRGGILKEQQQQQQTRNPSIKDFMNSDEECEELPKEKLRQILGGAYNNRYMSIERPPQNYFDPNSKKRGAFDEEMRFAVDETFAKELSGQPAWELDFADTDFGYSQSSRRRRSTDDDSNNQEQEEEEAIRELRSLGHGGGGGGETRPWDCAMEEIYTDLGEDYFPRFLRSVKCAQTSCYYGKYVCQPRSFTVQVLRRRRGRCVRGATRNSTGIPGQPLCKTGAEDSPAGLQELWVWEERALAFCCDCAKPVTNRWY